MRGVALAPLPLVRAPAPLLSRPRVVLFQPTQAPVGFSSLPGNVVDQLWSRVPHMLSLRLRSEGILTLTQLREAPRAIVDSLSQEPAAQPFADLLTELRKPEGPSEQEGHSTKVWSYSYFKSY